MKAIEIIGKGGPEVMVYRDVEPMKLEADGVRIAVKAAGVNFADLMMRMGLYPEAPKVPFVPGYEVAGEVLETGPSVLPGKFKKGQRVVAGCRFGGYTSEIVVPARTARPIPEGLSFEEAASLPVNWMTAWVAISEMGRVRAGDRVLIESAAGGVGVAAVQLVKAAGAIPIGLVGSPTKAQAVKDLGAAEVWTNDEWAKGAKKGERFQLILDAAGGKDLKRAFESLALGGRVVTFGVSTMVGGAKRSIFKVAGTMLSMPRYSPITLMNANKGVFGLNSLKLADEAPEMLERGFDEVLAGFAAKKYRAIVGKTFPLKDAGAAHEHLQSRGNIGKVVLIP